MGEPWLLVEPGQLRAGAEIELDPAESRHLARVLRRGPGAAVTVTDGAGSSAAAEVLAVGPPVQVRVGPPVAAPSLPRVRLALGVLHTAAMDLAVQKAVEVGVAALQPVVTARSQLDLRAARGRAGHWRRVARQALKQCRRAWALDVPDPVPLAEVLAATAADEGVLADPTGGGTHQLPAARARLLLVGPEGGLDDAELDAFDRAGWPRLRLGPFVLRAETAAVVGGALLVDLAEGA